MLTGRQEKWLAVWIIGEMSKPHSNDQDMAVSRDQPKKKCSAFGRGAAVEAGGVFVFLGWSAGWLAGDEDCQFHFLPKNTQKASNTQGHRETRLTLSYFR